MDAAGAVHGHEIAPVALGEEIALVFKRRLKRQGIVAGLVSRRHLGLDLLACDAGALLLSKLGAGGRPVRERNALAFVMSALDPLMAETAFQLAGDLFVLTVVMTVRNRPHVLKVDPRPDDMQVFAVFLLVQHRDAGVTVETELLFERVDGLGALFI